MGRTTIADNIKIQRIKNKLTQQDLAEKMYVTRQTISNYENGKSNPDMESLEQLTKIFGVDIDTLIYGDLSSERRTERIKSFWHILIVLIFLIGFAFATNQEKLVIASSYGRPIVRWINDIVIIPIMFGVLGREIAILAKRETELSAKLIKYERAAYYVKRIVKWIIMLYIFILILVCIGVISFTLEESSTFFEALILNIIRLGSVHYFTSFASVIIGFLREISE